ncbi:MAG: TFIIB-type zinc ribbon-containing protein [Desulfurococcales archaeon]|nr:TFIIB-type zinc ribbon-containing protein [Desulfurococcales archaeon]
MGSVRCPHCGSRKLVWDYERGEIICPVCGTVVDRIYINELPQQPGEGAAVTKGKEPRPSRITREYLSILEEIKRNKRLARKGFIDTKSFMEYMSGRRGKVGIIKVKMPSSALRHDVRLDKVLEVIRRFPRLNSRTERARYALGLIALQVVTRGTLSVDEVSKATGLSHMHVRRLAKIVLGSEAFLREVRRACLTHRGQVLGTLKT